MLSAEKRIDDVIVHPPHPVDPPSFQSIGCGIDTVVEGQVLRELVEDSLSPRLVACLIHVHHRSLKQKRLRLIRRLQESRPLIKIHHTRRIAVVELIGQHIIHQMTQVLRTPRHGETHRRVMEIQTKIVDW